MIHAFINDVAKIKNYVSCMAREEKMSKRVAMRIGEQALYNVIEGISLFFY